MVFPKAVFGKKERSFNADWYSKFPWFNYNIKSESLYCYICMIAHTKVQKAVSGNSDPAFTTGGFRKWKKYSERFLDHPNTVIHYDYEIILRLDEANIDIDELFQEQLPSGNADNRQMLLTILRNVQKSSKARVSFLWGTRRKEILTN